MRRFRILLFLLSSLCCAQSSLCWAQESGDFQPATTNVWGAEYPRVDSTGRVQLRVKAPDAEVVVAVTEGRLDFGPWEQIFYGEFDGGRRKRVLVKIIGE